jgi:two-component system, NarL family, response regulator DevR
MRVLILDHDCWREQGLARVLDSSPEISVVLERDLGDETWSKSQATVILVSDTSVRDDPRSSIERLRAKFPDVKILVHGEDKTAAAITDLLARGADGYFALSLGEEKLLKALAVLERGSVWAPEEAVISLVQQLRAGGTQQPEPLSASDRALLEMLHDGLSNKEMASRLGLAEITVKTRLARLYRRYGVKTRVQLLSFAVRNRLVAQA